MAAAAEAVLARRQLQAGNRQQPPVLRFLPRADPASRGTSAPPRRRRAAIMPRCTAGARAPNGRRSACDRERQQREEPDGKARNDLRGHRLERAGEILQQLEQRQEVPLGPRDVLASAGLATSSSGARTRSRTRAATRTRRPSSPCPSSRARGRTAWPVPAPGGADPRCHDGASGRCARPRTAPAPTAAGTRAPHTSGPA